jgi:U3 small nucleolar RNA-associated protein 20
VLEVDHQSTTFQLIRTLVAGKLVCPEMYTLMDKLQRLTVTSHMKGVRETAAQVFTQFLVHYPLSQKRLITHLRSLCE